MMIPYTVVVFPFVNAVDMKTNLDAPGISAQGSLTGTQIGPFALIAAAPGTVTGTEDGPFTFVFSTDDVLKIDPNSSGFQTVTFSAGERTTQQVVDEINAQTTVLTASVGPGNGAGKVIITSNVNDDLIIDSVSNGSTSNIELGFTSDGVTGSFTVGNNIFKIQTDSGGYETVTFTVGVRTVYQCIDEINAQTTGLNASNTGGRITIAADGTVDIEIDSTSNGSSFNATGGFNTAGEIGVSSADLILIDFSIIQHEGQWNVVAAYRPAGTDV